MRISLAYTYVLGLTAALLSCRGSQPQEEEQQTVTPVTVTSPAVGRMEERVELNATSAFLQKSSVKAPTSGFIESAPVQLGQRVGKGDALFILRTKEGAALDRMAESDPASNPGSGSDFGSGKASGPANRPANGFTGMVKVAAGGGGYVTRIDHQAGDYVVEGDQLAEVSVPGSLVFLVRMPYELNRYLPQNRTVALTLPGGRVPQGRVASAMPVVDPVSQTQDIVIKVADEGGIPENLMARTAFVTRVKANAVSLPREAVLTDETQENFWIMKVAGGDMAVKVPITRGLEDDGRVEVLSPRLSLADTILVTGNFGLPDSSKVTIQKP